MRRNENRPHGGETWDGDLQRMKLWRGGSSAVEARALYRTEWIVISWNGFLSIGKELLMRMLGKTLGAGDLCRGDVGVWGLLGMRRELKHK